MKKLSAVLAVLLALTCLLSVVSCGAPAKFERGAKESDCYKNESLGLQFTLPSRWKFYSDEELAQLTNISSELIKDKNALENADVTSLYEFMATDSSTGNNISLMAEKVAASMTEAKYVDALKKQLKDQFLNAEISISDETSSVELAGQTWTLLTSEVEYLGIHMDQYYFIRKLGTTMISIVVTDVTAKGIDFYKAMFTAYTDEKAD